MAELGDPHVAVVDVDPGHLAGLADDPVGHEVPHGADHRLQGGVHPPVHDVDHRRAVALDRGHRDHVGVGGVAQLPQRGLRVEPLAVLLEGVEHVGLSDVALRDQLCGVHRGRRISEGEAQLGLQSLALGQVGRRDHLVVVRVHRLLAQDVLAVLQRGPRHLEVHPVPGDHVDDVDVRVLHQLAVVGLQPGDPELRPGGGQRIRVGVGQCDHLDPRVPLPARNVRSDRPAAGPDHAYPQLVLRHVVSPVQMAPSSSTVLVCGCLGWICRFVFGPGPGSFSRRARPRSGARARQPAGPPSGPGPGRARRAVGI